jgi:hypothetical protein
MSGAEQALVTDTGDASELRKALADSIPKGPHPNPHAEWVTVRLDVVTGAIDHLEWLEKGCEEWRVMARDAQAELARLRRLFDASVKIAAELARPSGI